MTVQVLSMEMESRPCPLSCEAGDEFLFTGTDRLHGLPGEFRVVRCRGCGLMRTDPRPAPGSMGAFYPSDYSPHLYTRVTGRPHATSRRSWKRTVRALLDTRAEALPGMPAGRMLEIGCASGSYLHRMASEGWSVEGIEFSSAAADSARRLGHRVFEGRVEDAPEPEARFDLIVAWMALEHLYEPLAVLRRLRRWIRPDGWLVFSVPNAGSLEFAVFRDAWYALQLPTHLYHYTPRTLRKLLDHSGWVLEQVIHQRTISNLVASIGYALRDRGFRSVGASLVAYPERSGRSHDLLFPAAWLLASIGQTGRMTVWARPEEVG
ncbi:MAG: class I SAM-dependent methyltransferase [Thermoanaerobaculia bacterium]